MWVVVGIVGPIVASLGISMVVPRVDHLKDF
jgi:hypothetical protein